MTHGAHITIPTRLRLVCGVCGVCAISLSDPIAAAVAGTAVAS